MIATADRLVLGNLNANGISPAQWGFRASDSTGAPIFDSAGLIKVMTSLGISNPGAQNFTTGTFTLWTGSGVSFSLSRQANLLLLFVADGFLTAEGAANTGQIRSKLVGVATSGGLTFGNSTDGTLMGWQWAGAVPAGSYTAQLEGTGNGTTLNINGGALQVFLLGS